MPTATLHLLVLSLPLLINLIHVPAVSTSRCNYCGYGTHCKGRECVCWKGFVHLRRVAPYRLFTCQDRNECSEGSHHCKNGTMCVNRVGSYDCECYWGWHGPWVTTAGDYICTEKSLCETYFHRCGSGTHCVSSNTSDYTCICAIGFRSLKISREKEIYTCQDIDECVSSSKKACGENSVCANTHGSFHCKCLAGYHSSWKDDTDCVIPASEGQSAAKNLNSEQIVLVAGGSVVALVLCVVLCCIIFRRCRSRKQPIELKYHHNERPITISISPDRQSSYVNVTLTSSDNKCVSCDADDDQHTTTKVKVKAGDKHEYTNETIEPEFLDDGKTEFNARIQQETTLSSIAEDDDIYANRDTIKRIKRLSSRVQTKPENPRYSNEVEDAHISWHSENISFAHVPMVPEDNSNADIENGSIKDYDHLRETHRGSGNVSPDIEAPFTEHTYSLPEGTEDDLSDTECGLPSCNVYQPVIYTKVAGKVSKFDKNTGGSANYEPVIYSIPDKSKKKERIYMNDPKHAH